MSQLHCGARFLFTLSLLGAAACGKGESGAVPPGAEATAKTPAAEAKVMPYTYPAPVSGHYKEGNSGEFDLVDGLAWGPTRAGETAIYVTDKLIASPVLGATCPMAEARALSVLRNARYNTVDLDAKGKSRYYGAGTQYDGTSRSRTSGVTTGILPPRRRRGRIAGKVTNRYQAASSSTCRYASHRARSQRDRTHGRRPLQDRHGDPRCAAVSATCQDPRAALAKDLKGWLAAQAFGRADRGHPRSRRIDADLEQHALHFLSPEMPKDTEETEKHPGEGYVRAEGANSAGAKFINYYYLVPCGDRLLLGMIGENPQ
jgi:hypothetical protein